MPKAFDPRDPAESIPKMQRLASAIDSALNQGDLENRELGFFIVVTMLDTTDHRIQFIGSISTEQSVKLLRDTADFMEANGYTHGPGRGVH